MIVLPKYRETRFASETQVKTRVRSLAPHITKRQVVITLPAFSIDNTWRGASEIIKEYHYQLANNISLIRIAQPANPNYVACVAWKPTSETIVRYKLWNNIGEILYVPLYSGQRMRSDFSIEIWNTNSTPATNAGTALFTTSLMRVPDNVYCDTGAIEADEPDECTDVTFDFGNYGGSISDEFVPFDGDYYNVIGDCGVTELVKSVRFEGTGIILQSTDGTWHTVYVSRSGGFTYNNVDQEATSPSLTPYIYLQLRPGVGHKVNIQDSGNGYYFINTDQEATTVIDYSVLYLQAKEDSLFYGVRLRASPEGYVFVDPNQNNTIL